MIKGVRIGGNGKTLRFFDTLTVPIIENTADEEDLTDGMREAMEKYPEAAAVLVRRHGVYVWGMSCLIPDMAGGVRAFVDGN
jgi:methylthioribulose-1-phosphate dehydratase